MTDEEGAEYDRMCLAVIMADVMHRKMTAELATLRAENDRLRAELASSRAKYDLYKAAAKAENERLRDRVDELKTHNAQCGDRYDAAESSLAEAVKLLRRFTSASDGPGEYNGTYDDALAFLANQSAAPAREGR